MGQSYLELLPPELFIRIFGHANEYTVANVIYNTILKRNKYIVSFDRNIADTLCTFSSEYQLSIIEYVFASNPNMITNLRRVLNTYFSEQGKLWRTEVIIKLISDSSMNSAGDESLPRRMRLHRYILNRYGNSHAMYILDVIYRTEYPVCYDIMSKSTPMSSMLSNPIRISTDLHTFINFIDEIKNDTDGVDIDDEYYMTDNLEIFQYCVMTRLFKIQDPYTIYSLALAVLPDESLIKILQCLHDNGYILNYENMTSHRISLILKQIFQRGDDLNDFFKDKLPLVESDVYKYLDESNMIFNNNFFLWLVERRKLSSIKYIFRTKLYKPDGDLNDLRMNLLMSNYLGTDEPSIQVWKYLMSLDLGFNTVQSEKITSVIFGHNNRDDYYSDIEDLDVFENDDDDDFEDLDNVDDDVKD